MYVLAIAALLMMPPVLPRPLGLFNDRQACLQTAMKLNETSEELRKPEMRNAGVAFVCLKVVLSV